MEIVIDIDDDIYKSVVNNDDYILEEDVDWISLENAIANGTPLPKGHGKIIDADYTIKQLLSLPKNELSTEDMWAMKVLDLAPTIIEADKPESEEEE